MTLLFFFAENVGDVSDGWITIVPGVCVWYGVLCVCVCVFTTSTTHTWLYTNCALFFMQDK